MLINNTKLGHVFVTSPSLDVLNWYLVLRVFNFFKDPQIKILSKFKHVKFNNQYPYRKFKSQKKIINM